MCRSLTGRELGALLFPLGLVAHPYSGRSDQVCWEGATHDHHCTPGVCPVRLVSRGVKLPGRKSSLTGCSLEARPVSP